MQKGDIRILIVDDEESIGTALKEAFAREGFRAVHVSKPDDALAHVKLQPVHAAFIDCMLPKMNGQELAKKIKAEAPEAAIFLMSGIYRDKGFARESMQQTGAAAFFTKPFDLPALLKAVGEKFEGLLDGPRAPFHDVLCRPQLSMKDRLNAINESDTMHGLDLPWIYSLLMHPRITGHLNIVTAEGDVVGVGLQRGNIVQVMLQDTRSYFGVLVVERGFISSADLEAAMAEAGTRSKRMGDRLVDMNLLSPHAIEIVVADQLGIRLSRTIGNTSVKVNFIEADEIREDAQIDRHAYNELLHEWASSKFPIDWLRAFYMPWLRWNFVKAQEWTDTHRAFNLPLLATKPGFAQSIVAGKTLEQLLSESEADEAAFYKRLHFLVLARLVSFGEAASSVGDYALLRKRLTKLNAELEGQTHFERLGVSRKAKPAEIKRGFHELAKVLHPDKLDPATPADVRELTRSCFAKVSQAYEILSDEARREEYVQLLEQGNAEKVLEAESLSEQAKVFLNKGEAGRALPIFLQAAELAPPSVDLRLHIAWARLKQPGDRSADALAQVRETLSSIPPEDRHSAIYVFVKGLLSQASDDPAAARKFFESALAIDDNFIAAKREQNLLRLQQAEAKNADLLRGDLRDVVGMLFKKKK